MDPKRFREIIKEELRPLIKTQEEQSQILQGHTQILQEHSQILNKHSQILEEHTDKIDSIIGELHQVHQLADTILDVVKTED